MTPVGAAIVLALVAAGIEVPLAPAEVPSSQATTERFDTLVLDHSTPDSAALERELGLRLHARVIVVAHEDMDRPRGAFVWGLVEPADDDSVRVRLITSDGRAFTRAVDAPPDQQSRVIAGAIANMVDAIESNRITPQETNAEVPVPPSSVEPEPARASPPSPTPTSSPPPLAAPEPPSSWLGATLDGGIAVALGPPTDLQGFGGGLVGAGVRWVHRSGAVVAAQVHALITRSSGFVATRPRVYAGAGYAWRPSRFELVTDAGFVVAPIFIGASEGSARLRTASGVRRAAAPLVGARVAISPGWFVWSRPDDAGLRLGLTLEAGYSVEARAPAGALRILHDDGETTAPILRAGGLELGVLLSLEARFALYHGRKIE